ncbi:MAG: MarC family protein [Deltaproteobacteria bacterium]|nr:MarC family protein [Deltaproteobacteria bacterium]
MEILSATILLFLVIDPLGNVPFFLCVLKKVEERRRKAVLLRELGIAFGMLVLFLFGGQYLLLVLQVSEPSLSIAGGIILFIIALRMIFLGSEKVFEDILGGEPFIVPLAIPSIAGPSAMATVLLLMAREPTRWPEWLAALAAACLLAGLILLYSSRLIQLLGERVLVATERLMGMILTTVAVEMFLSALRTLYPSAAWPPRI